MSGSANGTQLGNIVQNVDASGAVIGTPGTWSVSVAHAIMGAVGAGGAGTGPLGPADAALVQAAVNKSNAAAANTPGAASGTPTSANTSTTIIDGIVTGITNIASIPADIKQFEAGATGTLHWWGWELNLNESATLALESLLQTDLSNLLAIATALTVFSAPLAAFAAVLATASHYLGTWISTEDSAKQGVVIDGYLWIGVWVTPA